MRRRASVAEQRAEDEADDRVRDDLLAEDATVAEQRRPRAAAPVGVPAVDRDHQGPRRHVLELEEGDGVLRAAQADPVAEDAGRRAVREVQSQSGRAPMPAESGRPSRRTSE